MNATVILARLAVLGALALTVEGFNIMSGGDLYLSSLSHLAQVAPEGGTSGSPPPLPPPPPEPLPPPPPPESTSGSSGGFVAPPFPESRGSESSQPPPAGSFGYPPPDGQQLAPPNQPFPGQYPEGFHSPDGQPPPYKPGEFPQADQGQFQFQGRPGEPPQGQFRPGIPGGQPGKFPQPNQQRFNQLSPGSPQQGQGGPGNFQQFPGRNGGQNFGPSGGQFDDEHQGGEDEFDFEAAEEQRVNRELLRIQKDLDRITKQVGRVEKAATAKSLNGLGLNLTELIAKMKSALQEAKQAADEGDVDGAREAMSYFFDEANPDQVARILSELRQLTSPAKSKKNQRTNPNEVAALRTAIKEIVEALNDGNVDGASEAFAEGRQILKQLLRQPARRSQLLPFPAPER